MEGKKREPYLLICPLTKDFVNLVGQNVLLNTHMCLQHLHQ